MLAFGLTVLRKSWHCAEPPEPMCLDGVGHVFVTPVVLILTSHLTQSTAVLAAAAVVAGNKAPLFCGECHCFVGCGVLWAAQLRSHGSDATQHRHEAGWC